MSDALCVLYLLSPFIIFMVLLALIGTMEYDDRGEVTGSRDGLIVLLWQYLKAKRTR